MSEIQIGDKEKISVLALEYSSLRSHITARMSHIVQFGAVVVAVTALAVQQCPGMVVVILLLGVIAFLIGLKLLWRDVTKVGRRVQALEAEINRRAGEKLLIWETDLGGLSDGYWR